MTKNEKQLKNNKENRSQTLVMFDDEKSVGEFLQQPSIKIAEFMTGFLSSDTNEWKRSAGYLVQATIKNKLFTQLGIEIKKYIEDGKIKEDYLSTAKNQATFIELLKFIDEETFDEEKFEAMKSIFLYSVEKDSDQQREELVYEIMRVCRQLSSQQILILKVTYNSVINKQEEIGNLSPSISDWLNFISHEIGHNIPSLVELHEQKLIDLKLITKRTYQDKSGFSKDKHFRLTELGYQLCELINKY